MKSPQTSTENAVIKKLVCWNHVWFWQGGLNRFMAENVTCFCISFCKTGIFCMQRISRMRSNWLANFDFFPFFCHISWKQDSAPLQLHGSRTRKERQNESTSHLLSCCWGQQHSSQLQRGRPHYIASTWSQRWLALWGEWEDKNVSVCVCVASWGFHFCGGSLLWPYPFEIVKYLLGHLLST